MIGDAWNTSKIYWNEFRKPIWVVSIVEKHETSDRPRACMSGGNVGGPSCECCIATF